MKKPTNKHNLEREIKSLSFWMIAIGIIHIVAAGFLSFFWGFVLIAFGIFSLISKRIIVFLIFGILILIAGLSNLSNSLLEIAYYSGSGFSYFWVVFGGFQIWWGVNEIIKYGNIRKGKNF